MPQGKIIRKIQLLWHNQEKKNSPEVKRKEKEKKEKGKKEKGKNEAKGKTI